MPASPDWRAYCDDGGTTGLKIQIITNLFHPDELAGASLYTDLALYLKEQGHDVRVTTTFSYYPRWKLQPEDAGIPVRDETFEGIPVRRVRMYVPARPSGSRRIVSDLSFFKGLVRHAAWNDWQPEVVLTASPMLSQCLAQRFLYAGKKIPRVIVVQDFVVDAALELKFLNVPGIAHLLFAVERWAFNSADCLTTISRKMLDKLRGKVAKGKRTVLIPNWIHRSLQAEIARQRTGEPPSRQRGALLYAGNLGVKQGLADFVNDFSRGDTRWILKIHGGGAESAVLRDKVSGISSITVGGVLDEAEYVAELRRASACLVTQKPGVGANFLPSKLLPALATATPVLAVCEISSPLGAEVIEGGFGAVVAPGDKGALARVLQAWIEHPEILAEMSRKAFIRSGLYTRETVLPQYLRELENLARPAQETAGAPYTPFPYSPVE